MRRALQELGRLEAGHGRVRPALALEPDYADAHVAKAISLLLRGDYASGWRGVDWSGLGKGG